MAIASYVLLCALAAPGCPMPDGTVVAPNGAVSGPYLWDGETPWNTPGLTPAPYTGQPVWQAAAPALTPAQQAEAALASCAVTITSTGTPTLSGTYACDPETTSDISSTVLYILTNGTFPLGASALPWPDVTGALHVFGTTAAFRNWASAEANYVTGLKLVVSGVSSALPTPTATIP